MNNLPISVWLSEYQALYMHCIICGFPIGIKIEGSPNTIIYGLDATEGIEDITKRPLQMPIRIKCKYKNSKWGKCPALYIIQGYIYPKNEE